jgi:hypothetical protein
MLRIAKIIKETLEWIFCIVAGYAFGAILLFVYYKLSQVSGLTWYILGCMALTAAYFWSDYIINKHK